MKRINIVLIVGMIICVLFSVSMAEESIAISDLHEEDAINTEEKALLELQPMLENDKPEEIEGMDLEALSDRYLNEYTKEYVDGETGFSFLYPVWFQFDESSGNLATNEDKTALLSVNTVPLDTAMNPDEINSFLSNSGFSEVTTENNGCIRAEKNEGNGKLKVLICKVSERYLYIVEMEYPTEQKDNYAVYVEYLIHSMTADDTELG